VRLRVDRAMKANLRDWIQEAGAERGLLIDQPLEDFIFYVASLWSEHRFEVAEAIKNSTYKPVK
jgi:hypothetical protein